MITRLRAWIRSFFGFRRTETNAFIILLPLMTVLIFSEPAYRYWVVRQPQDFSRQQKELDSVMTTWQWEVRDSVKNHPVEIKLFSFNPNQVTKEKLIELGFTPVLANRIVHFQLKGGKFIVKKDLMKIYGMDSILYKKLFPFIKLPENIISNRMTSVLPLKEKPVFTKFDLNTADTSQLIKIYGIGPKLSKRIIAYRHKLGGFISLHQLQEVYGLDSVVISELSNKSMITESFTPRFLDLNSATEKELSNHPYIKTHLAKAITAYRFQHGSFQSVEDLKKITLIDDQKFQKIKPYLSINH